MKVLVFGARGQVGEALRRTSPFDDVIFLDRAAADLTDHHAIERALHSAMPDVVINAAAFTSVDSAEGHTAEAFAVNEHAPAALAAHCLALGARLVHLSTDYVFDGSSARAYLPDDAAKPLNTYGRSKLAGEERIRATQGLDFLILRTAWVYSGHGRNFLRTMLDVALSRHELRVVSDQIGSPTSARTLAAAIWLVAGRTDIQGTMHFTDGGEVNRREFAEAILIAAHRRSLPVGAVTIEEITSEQFAIDNPGTAHRPRYSALDSRELRGRIGLPDCGWASHIDEAIDHYVKRRG